MTVVVRLESCIIFRLSDKIPELTSPRGIVTPFLKIDNSGPAHLLQVRVLSILQ